MQCKDKLHFLSCFGLGEYSIDQEFGTRTRSYPPHKGIDIASPKAGQVFLAGIPGRIVPPLGGKWGIISLNPDKLSSTLVQYIHCEEILCNIGDRVTAMTEIGTIGNRGHSKINLHIQVSIPGKPKFSDWKQFSRDRDFVDPINFFKGYYYE
ncbi:MAG: M23 family metallopeptidase [Kordiimonas sp.]